MEKTFSVHTANAKAVMKMTNKDKVTLTFTVGEIKEMLLPLYEFSIFDMIRNDPDIDNPKWLQGQMRIYGRLLNLVEGGEDE